MPTRPLLDAAAIAEPALAAMEKYHADLVRHVADTVRKDPVVVIGMMHNPNVGQARRALDAAGIPHTYLEYGSYLHGWRRRLAIKLWSGWPTYPQVFVRGVLIGGGTETKKALADGTLQRRIAAS